MKSINRNEYNRNVFWCGRLKIFWGFEIKSDNIRKIISNLDDLKVIYFEIVVKASELDDHLVAFTEIEEETEKLKARLRKFLLLNNKSESAYNVNNSKLDN